MSSTGTTPPTNATVSSLARLSEPLLERVSSGTVGLDFGSGPGPTLAVMLEEAGLKVRLFDPFYAPDETVWTERYAFIAASEVLEHLRDPAGELDRLFGVLNPGGVAWRDDQVGGFTRRLCELALHPGPDPRRFL